MLAMTIGVTALANAVTAAVARWRPWGVDSLSKIVPASSHDDDDDIDAAWNAAGSVVVVNDVGLGSDR
jgi:hypothetical protein